MRDSEGKHRDLEGKEHMPHHRSWGTHRDIEGKEHTDTPHHKKWVPWHGYEEVRERSGILCCASYAAMLGFYQSAYVVQMAYVLIMLFRWYVFYIQA